MKVTVIPIVMGELDIVTKELIKELEDLEIRGRAETIEVAVLLRSAWILRRILETWEDLLLLQIQWENIS